MTEKKSPMPDFYVPPLNTPVHWRNDQSGILPAAVMALHAHGLDATKPFQGKQFALVRDYLRYYIQAPCWQDDEDGDIARLRASVQGLKTPEDMSKWIMRCLDVGIDPL